MFATMDGAWAFAVPQRLARALNITDDDNGDLVVPAQTLECLRQRFEDPDLEAGEDIRIDLSPPKYQIIRGATRIGVRLSRGVLEGRGFGGNVGLLFDVDIFPYTVYTNSNIIAIATRFLNLLSECSAGKMNIKKQLSAENVESAKGVPPGAIVSMINPRFSGPNLMARRKARELKQYYEERKPAEDREARESAEAVAAMKAGRKKSRRAKKTRGTRRR